MQNSCNEFWELLRHPIGRRLKSKFSKIWPYWGNFMRETRWKCYFYVKTLPFFRNRIFDKTRFLRIPFLHISFFEICIFNDSIPYFWSVLLKNNIANVFYCVKLPLIGWFWRKFSILDHVQWGTRAEVVFSTEIK